MVLKAEGMAPVSFGITTPQHHVSYEELLRLWQRAEELGYNSAWVFDHFIPIAGAVEGPCLEAMVTLTALAVQTRQLRVGVLVSGNTYRHPAVHANMAATLDVVTGGRVEWGMGAAWYGLEHSMYGIPFPPTGRRIRMMGEAIQVMKRLWMEPRVTFRGRYYQLTDAFCEPKPVQNPHPPVWVGGGGESLTLPIVAEHADGWNYMAPPEQYAQKLQVLARHCGDRARDIASIRKSIHFVLGIDRDQRRARDKAENAYARSGVPVGEDRESAIIGTPAECVDQLGQYVALGVDHFIVVMRPPYDYEGLELFAREVVPSFG